MNVGDQVLTFDAATSNKFRVLSETCRPASNTSADAEGRFRNSASEASAASRLPEHLQVFEAEVASIAAYEPRPLLSAALETVAAENAREFQPPLPARRAASRSYAEIVTEVAAKHDIDPDFLHAIMFVESRANPRAVSHAGARGLMQVMPATARRFGVRHPMTELLDPYTNINVAAVYLKKLQSMFGNDLKLVLAGYNAGEGAVLKYGRRVPPYRETQGYVKSVMARYSALAGGGALGR